MGKLLKKDIVRPVSSNLQNSKQNNRGSDKNV